ncbi:MAG: ABC transporter ATP-binding protein [Firmicutes bacterium]|nr:ABC transporter ATP-binding protein [Bacillota bacterium]
MSIAVKQTSDITRPLVALRDVHRVFKTGNTEVRALDGVDMSIFPGQLVVIKGRSGSGKTTALNMMGGLDQPTRGQVLFKGEDISTFNERMLTRWRRKEVGFVFQSFGLLPYLTAYENVELPLKIVGRSLGERRARTEECLELVGLGPRAQHRILELSGGEQQRVAIARALTISPSLILADEPTGELDFATSMKVMELFRSLVDEHGVTICVVSHNPAVEEFGDKVYEMADGRVLEGE